MPPSLSSIERGNPPPRRKSCAACIKAKRRCDLRQPSCLRCSQRRLDCSYPAHAEGLHKRRGDTSSSSSSSQSPDMQPPPLPQKPMKDGSALAEPAAASWESSFDFNMDISAGYDPSCATYPHISFDEPGFQGLEFLEDVVNLHHPLESSIPPTPGPTVELGREDPMPLIPRPSKLQLDSVTKIQLLRAAAELTEKRLLYAIDAFKRAPEEMVLEGGTAWSHPALYRDSMPACLEDALAACGLHRAKNKVNTPMIQRVIEQRYHRLVAAPIPTPNVSEMLARTHALLLYQIMLFFDDSCTSRALTRETMSALSDSALALLEFTRYETEEDSDGASRRDIPLYPLTAARALYNDWTFQESLRRTLLVSFLFTQLQSLLQADFSSLVAPSPQAAAECFAPTSGPSPPDAQALAAIRQALQQIPAVTEDEVHSNGEDEAEAERARRKCTSQMLLCQSFTLSAHLWHARDPVDFAVAWRDKRHFVVHPWNVWKCIETAQVDDIDQLGRILMTSGMGIEEAKGWFASRGGTL
ncbi:hypothetical protein GGR55DRAFT_225389 [Xylaria sp. FL0064]|nr:hypothetical protein GGR55DRAFT_225389 [Xylaria sp. FL0064]